MAEQDRDDILFQTRVDPALHARFIRQRERWGMSNQEILKRLLEAQLPIWEQAPGPPTAK